MNAFIPYLHFKMEGLHLLKNMLKEKNYTCKIDLKDPYFCVPLHQNYRKYTGFVGKVSSTNSCVYVLAWDQLHEFLQSY